MFTYASSTITKFLSEYPSSPFFISPIGSLEELTMKMNQYLQKQILKKETLPRKSVRIKKVERINETNTLPEDFFFPRRVKTFIEKHFHSDSVDEYETDELSLEVSLYKERSHSPEIFRNLSFYLSTIIGLIVNVLVTNEQNHYSTCQRITLFLIPTLLHKVIPTLKVWDSEVINNAFSKHGKCDSIFIYRLEEILKVSIHECIHVLYLDDIRNERSIRVGKMEMKIGKKKIDLNNPYEATLFFEKKFAFTAHFFPVLFTEAYVEAWATILNSVHASCITKHSVTDLLILEQKFMCFQVAKILYASGFSSWSSFMGKKDHARDSPNITQTTSLFSYFILRCALLWDLRWFFSVFTNIQFSKNNIDVASCYKYCLYIFESDTFAKIIDFYILQVSVIPKDLFIFKTMRMTCIELNLC